MVAKISSYAYATLLACKAFISFRLVVPWQRSVLGSGRLVVESPSCACRRIA